MKYNPLTEHSIHLRNLALKTQGLAHLIEIEGFSQGPPEDQEDVFYGISLILQEISIDLKKLSEKIEKIE